MKRLFLILFLVYFDSAYSQNISIELSIKWIFETDKLDEIKQENVPYLLINYTNNTNKDVYFVKGSSNSNGIPRFICTRLYQKLISQNTTTTNDSIFNVKFNNYIVYITGSQNCKAFWEIYSVNVNFFEEHESDLINDKLFNFYTNLKFRLRKDTINNFEDQCPYNDSFRIENISNCLINSFVFLKSGTSYTEQFNLIGFKHLKGNFKFCIADTFLMTYVYGETKWNKYLKKVEIEKIELPQVVKDYILYSGTFQTNSVEIKF